MKTTFKADGALTFTVQVTLSEAAARALYTIALFDEGVFEKAAKAAMGSAWSETESGGIAELFLAARDGVSPIIRRADKARRAFRGDE